MFEHTPVFDSYWQFAAERQAILMRRLRGEQPPWTVDPILRDYRFTNVYRATDRVSQHLIADVIYGDGRSQDPQELFARIILFKIFNRIDTWKAIEQGLGRPFSWHGLDRERLSAILDAVYARGNGLYSAAYIMPSPPFGHARKHRNHLAMLFSMMDDGLPASVANARSLSEVYSRLLERAGLGPFLAFQFAIDLNYSTLTDFDESDFVVAGPGARDGISKCFAPVPNLSAEDIIMTVCGRQEHEFAARSIDFEYLGGRRLKPIDCQNLFCEISKYARVRHPEFLGALGRTRIKQGYRATEGQRSKLFLPPKWLCGVNV